MIREIEIETLRILCRDDKIKWTLHALKRIRKRKIPSEAVINGILSGEIIKQYQDDKPLPSCLIFNGDIERPLHIVASTDGEKVYLITAYYPTPDEWGDNYKTRKER
jgi:hypothetical protein